MDVTTPPAIEAFSLALDQNPALEEELQALGTAAHVPSNR